MTSSDTAADDAQRLVERLRQATLGFFDVLTIYLGQRLGFYEALSAAGALPAPELARRTGAHARYVREWLEQQAAAGLLRVDDVSLPPDERRFSLPPGHGRVLVEREDPLWQGMRPHSLLQLTREMEALLERFRTGGGRTPEEHDEEGRIAQATLGRVAYLESMGGWIAALPDVEARLREPGARVADVGCGAGWSAIALARAFPLAVVDGFDLDPASIALARENAASAGVAGRVRFSVRDAADPVLEGAYDLAVVFEALHDMPRPVEALRTLARLAGASGAVLVVDEKTEESFTAPAPELERVNYGWSVLTCLSTAMSGPDPAGTGTVMRPDTLRAYARAAGFSTVEILPIAHDSWSFYRLRP